MRIMSKGMTRRDFLKNAAAGTAGIAAMGLMGAPAAAAEQPAASPGVFDENGLFTPDFLIPPEPYTAFDEELSADVVVVGLGLAGICAARSASESGAKVIAIEQSETINCRASQFGTINNSYQNACGLVFSEEDKRNIVAEQMKANNYRPNQAIWQYFVNNSGAAFDWYISACPEAIFLDPAKTPKESGYDAFDMNDGNVYVCLFNYPMSPKYKPAEEYYPMYPTVTVVKPSQLPVNERIVADLEAKENVTLRFKTTGKQLIKDESGRIVGVYAEDLEGRVIKLNAERGVILACGDYGSNLRMRDYYSRESFEIGSWIWPNVDAKGEPTNMGMGIKLGAWVGAKVEPGAHTIMAHAFGGALGCDPFLLVDNNGQRFMNEDVPGNIWSMKFIRLPQQTAWQIFDDNYPQQVHTMPNGHAGYWEIIDDVENEKFGQYLEKIGQRTKQEVEDSCTCICNSLEELAEEMGLPFEALKATIDRYNENARNGFDADFGKRADRLYPIEKPPFYATKMVGAFAFCMVAGLLTDADCRVMDQDYAPISGLYAVGNTMGGRFAQDYPTITMGCSHGFCLTFGKLAGENAAKKLS